MDSNTFRSLSIHQSLQEEFFGEILGECSYVLKSVLSNARIKKPISVWGGGVIVLIIQLEALYFFILLSNSCLVRLKKRCEFVKPSPVCKQSANDLRGVNGNNIVALTIKTFYVYSDFSVVLKIHCRETHIPSNCGI